MKTVILIHRSDSKDFQDNDILSIVEEAGDSTLLVDGPVAAKGSPSSPIKIVRLSPRKLLGQARSDDTFTAAERLMQLKGDSRTIWLFDTRALEMHDVAFLLQRLRSQIFYLAEPPRALVLYANRDLHIAVLEEVRSAFGFSRMQEKILRRAVHFGWLMAIFARIFGIRYQNRAHRLAKRLSRHG